MSEPQQAARGVTNLEPHRQVGLPVLPPATPWAPEAASDREFHENHATFPDDASGSTGSPRSGDDPAGSDDEDTRNLDSGHARVFSAPDLRRDDHDDMLGQLMLGQPAGGLASVENDDEIGAANHLLPAAYARISTLQEQVSILHKRLKMREDRANELLRRNRMLNKLEKGYTALMNDLRTEFVNLPERGASSRCIKRELLRIASYFHTADQVCKLFGTSRTRAKLAKSYILAEHRVHDLGLVQAAATAPPDVDDEGNGGASMQGYYAAADMEYQQMYRNEHAPDGIGMAGQEPAPSPGQDPAIDTGLHGEGDAVFAMMPPPADIGMSMQIRERRLGGAAAKRPRENSAGEGSRDEREPQRLATGREGTTSGPGGEEDEDGEFRGPGGRGDLCQRCGCTQDSAEKCRRHLAPMGFNVHKTGKRQSSCIACLLTLKKKPLPPGIARPPSTETKCRTCGCTATSSEFCRRHKEPSGFGIHNEVQNVVCYACSSANKAREKAKRAKWKMDRLRWGDVNVAPTSANDGLEDQLDANGEDQVDEHAGSHVDHQDGLGVLPGLDGTGYDERHVGYHGAGNYYHTPASGTDRMHFMQNVLGAGGATGHPTASADPDVTAPVQAGLYFSTDDLGLLPPMPTSSVGQYPRGAVPPVRRGVNSLAV